MTRYAILAGSNFVGTPSELRGCINDLVNVRAKIEPSGITILADLHDKDMTTNNWKNAMKEAAAKAIEGDVILHMHSHHGAQTKSANGLGLDEIWCPDDFDWSDEHMIRDKWMGDLVSSLKPGVKWIDWADCCHAGDSLRDLWCPNEKPRYIKNPKLINFVSNGHLNPIVAGNDRKGMLLAACRSNQTSADAFINGQSCGAFSHYFLQSLNETPNASYEKLIIRTTQMLGLGGYDQRPEMDCNFGDEKGSFAVDVLGASKTMRKIRRFFTK